MKILIVGCGVIGTIYGWALSLRARDSEAMASSPRKLPDFLSSVSEHKKSLGSVESSGANAQSSR